ncbi:MAG: hypothetical protein M1830_003535, partial [Pleopsidium flavum]
AIDNAKDRVTVRTMRWLHSTTSCKPAETTAKAGGYFSTPDGFLPSWGNEAFNNTSYTRCDIDAARSHAHNIAAKLKCPVNSVTGALAGMVVDQRPHEDCLAVPVNVDFASKGVSLQPLTTVKTFLLMVTSTKPEVDFTILWLKFLDIVRCRAPAVSGITVEAAESWMAFREQMKRPLVRIRRWEMKKEEEEGAMGDWGNEQWAQGAQGAWHALRRGDMYWTCQKRLH